MTARAQVRIEQVFEERRGLLQEVHLQQTRASLHVDPEIELGLRFLRNDDGRDLFRSRRFTADSMRNGLDAVDAHFKLMRFFGEPNSAAQSQLDQLRLDHVLAFDWKVITNRDAAARSERSVFALAIVLRDVQRNLERFKLRNGRRKTGREPRHLAGHRQVALEVRRGNRERVGEVVEAPVGRFVAAVTSGPSAAGRP